MHSIKIHVSIHARGRKGYAISETNAHFTESLRKNSASLMRKRQLQANFTSLSLCLKCQHLLLSFGCRYALLEARKHH